VIQHPVATHNIVVGGLLVAVMFMAFASSASANPCAPVCAPTVVTTTTSEMQAQRYTLTNTISVENVREVKTVTVTVIPPCGGKCKPAKPICHRGEVCRKGRAMRCSRRIDRSCPVAKRKRVVRKKVTRERSSRTVRQRTTSNRKPRNLG
jgi:hypothetical protein